MRFFIFLTILISFYWPFLILVALFFQVTSFFIQPFPFHIDLFAIGNPLKLIKSFRELIQIGLLLIFICLFIVTFIVFSRFPVFKVLTKLFIYFLSRSFLILFAAVSTFIDSFELLRLFPYFTKTLKAV